MAMNKTVFNKSGLRFRDSFAFGLSLAAIVFLVIIANGFFFRWDLTADQRFTVSPATQKMLAELKDPVTVEVYLDGEPGDLPPGFLRLKGAIKETLDEFANLSGGFVEYKFTNPSASSDSRERNSFYEQLSKKGIMPTNLMAQIDGKKVEKIIFPGALISVGGNDVPVMLLKGNQTLSAEDRLNQSAEGVEYEFAAAIKKATEVKKKAIGFITGHGELEPEYFNDMGRALGDIYDIVAVDLPNKISLDEFDLIIVAKPTKPFSEPDKFKLDQYLVKGGKLAIFVDPLRAEIDSITSDGSLAMPYELNLDDFFYKYGLRVNKDLAMDMLSAYIPLVVGMVGDQPQTRVMPWRYFPLLNNFPTHPITRNIDGVLSRFTSTIDTVKAEGIKKTPLVTTSKYSRIIPAPARLSFNDARQEPAPEQYNRSFLPVCYLLEGSFNSLYTNRLAPITIEKFKFAAKDKPGKLLVFADGDIPANEVNKEKTISYPAGFDRFAKIQFGNRDFVLNAVAYLLDGQGLITARGRQLTLRPLDKVRIKNEKKRWQIINVVAPIVLVSVFGLFRNRLRNKKYAV